MADFNGTPGPWGQVVRNYGCKEIHRIGGEGEDIFSIQAIGYTHGREESEDEANARLIAAAPEMLEMLIQARGELNNYTKNHLGEKNRSVRDCISNINAIISKATE